MTTLRKQYLQQYNELGESVRFSSEAIDAILVDRLIENNVPNTVRILIDGKYYKTKKNKSVWRAKSHATNAFKLDLLYRANTHAYHYNLNVMSVYNTNMAIDLLLQQLIKDGRLIYEIN